jgi:hypothetical protein
VLRTTSAARRPSSVVTGADLTGPAVQEAIVSLRHLAASTPGLGEPVTTVLLGHGKVLVVSVPLAGSGSDGKSMRRSPHCETGHCQRASGRFTESTTR